MMSLNAITIAAGVQVIEPHEDEFRVERLWSEMLHLIGPGILAVHTASHSAAHTRQRPFYCIKGHVALTVLCLESPPRQFDALRVQLHAIDRVLQFLESEIGRSRQGRIRQVHHRCWSSSAVVCAASGRVSRSHSWSACSAADSSEVSSFRFKTASRCSNSFDVSERMTSSPNAPDV